LFFWLFAWGQADPSGLANLASISNCLFGARRGTGHAGTAKRHFWIDPTTAQDGAILPRKTTDVHEGYGLSV